jgi:branched-chain amino acid transport system ATP-binding protein
MSPDAGELRGDEPRGQKVDAKLGHATGEGGPGAPEEDRREQAPPAPAAQNGKAVLQLDEVHAYYGHIHALHGITLEVRGGEIVTLIGANGAGKTTTLKTISGLLHPRAGDVRFDGHDISRTASHQLVKEGIGHAPEGRRIFPRLTVMENLLMGGYTRKASEVQEDLARVFQLFPRLRERAGQQGGTLSGGEQQMLAIGRALMSRPKLLLLDEPSLGLAPILVQQIFEIIREINAQGTTILLVEQNALQALGIAHRGYVLQTGRVILADTAAGLAANQDVRRAYLGEI